MGGENTQHRERVRACARVPKIEKKRKQERGSKGGSGQKRKSKSRSESERKSKRARERGHAREKLEFATLFDKYRVAKTHRMPHLIDHFPQISH